MAISEADIEREQDVEELRRIALAQHAQILQLIAKLKRKCDTLSFYTEMTDTEMTDTGLVSRDDRYGEMTDTGLASRRRPTELHVRRPTEIGPRVRVPFKRAGRAQ